MIRLVRKLVLFFGELLHAVGAAKIDFAIFVIYRLIFFDRLGRIKKHLTPSRGFLSSMATEVPTNPSRLLEPSPKLIASFATPKVQRNYITECIAFSTSHLHTDRLATGFCPTTGKTLLRPKSGCRLIFRNEVSVDDSFASFGVWGTTLLASVGVLEAQSFPPVKILRSLAIPPAYPKPLQVDGKLTKRHGCMLQSLPVSST